MKSILVLSQFFYPDKTATGKILAELFEGLAGDGFKIDVIASQQEYGAKEHKILPSYEEWANIRIFRCFRFFKSKDKPIGRIFNYIMVFLLTALTCFHHGLHCEKDFVVAVSNPPIMPVLGALLRSKKRKFVYILHDLYPDIAVAMGVVGKGHLFSRIMRWANTYAFHHADKIVVLGRDMRQYLIDNYQVQANKIDVISNWATKDFNSPFENKIKLRTVYTGNLGRFHNLDIAVKAIGDDENNELYFVGEGASKTILMDMAANMSNIHFLPFLSMDEYAKMLTSSDVLFVSLEQNLSGLAVPSKFYTYLSAGRPILCVSDKDTEMAMLISEYNCGFVVKHGDVQGFKNALDTWHDNPDLKIEMGRNAHRLYEEKYKKDKIIKKYSTMFSKSFV